MTETVVRSEGEVRKGLILLEKGKFEALRWEHINTLWHGMTQVGIMSENTSQAKPIYDKKMRLDKKDGTAFELPTDWLERSKVGDVIEHEFTQRRLPSLVERYDAGAPLVFGNLSVDLHGVSNGQESLPWREVEGMEVGPEFVTIKRQWQPSDWFHKPTLDIPNACLLNGMLGHIRETRFRIS
jgi:hypothetical protein